jgi:catechol 2,3-dioxygenase-like lactoylglutathione lyase family enzyme
VLYRAPMLAAAPLIGFIPVRDLTVARRFYADTLGLLIVDETPQAVVAEAGGGATIRIVLVGEFEPQPFTVVGWSVPDVERALARLRGHGIETTRYDAIEQDDSGVWTAPNGDRVAWFQDPDANVLSVTQFASDAAEEASRSAGWSAPPPPGPPPEDDPF